jgi:hypothetical protein
VKKFHIHFFLNCSKFILYKKLKTFSGGKNRVAAGGAAGSRGGARARVRGQLRRPVHAAGSDAQPGAAADPGHGVRRRGARGRRRRRRRAPRRPPRHLLPDGRRPAPGDGARAGRRLLPTASGGVVRGGRRPFRQLPHRLLQRARHRQLAGGTDRFDSLLCR